MPGIRRSRRGRCRGGKGGVPQADESDRREGEMRDVGINVVVRARGRLEIEGLRADDDFSEMALSAQEAAASQFAVAR